MTLSNNTLLQLLALPSIGNKRALLMAEYLNAQGLMSLNHQDLYDFASQFSKGKTEFATLEEKSAWLTNADRILDASAERGITTINCFDARYPKQLANMIDPPVLIHALGDLSTIMNQPSIAVIGTREPTDWGYRSGERIAMKLAEAGINIVSGLAIGCDMAGHIGALKAKGTTTAVLAHGLQGIYPKCNRPLAERILAEGGVLISEYAIGETPQRGHFIQRDRIQAGLSLGTFVIETGVEGGSIHTMEYTLKYGRELFCLAHPDELLGEPKVQGNLQYLKNGQAKALQNKEDVDALIQRLKSGEMIQANSMMHKEQQMLLI